jgi:hypothetical protein
LKKGGREEEEEPVRVARYLTHPLVNISLSDDKKRTHSRRYPCSDEGRRDEEEEDEKAVKILSFLSSNDHRMWWEGRRRETGLGGEEGGSGR